MERANKARPDSCVGSRYVFLVILPSPQSNVAFACDVPPRHVQRPVRRLLRRCAHLRASRRPAPSPSRVRVLGRWLEANPGCSAPRADPGLKVGPRHPTRRVHQRRRRLRCEQKFGFSGVRREPRGESLRRLRARLNPRASRPASQGWSLVFRWRPPGCAGGGTQFEDPSHLSGAGLGSAEILSSSRRNDANAP